MQTLIRSNNHLNTEQIDHFLQYGYVVVPNCFSREAAEEWTGSAFRRIGYDRWDSSTWRERRVVMGSSFDVELKDFSPKAWQATCDLLGGEENIKQPYKWGDAFVMNLNEGLERPWEAPGANSNGWHVDGDWFRHYLDSAEQGLLTLCIWSDIEPKGGGTYIACDSVAKVTRYLAEHPEGTKLHDIPFREIVAECTDFREMTGQVGDVVFCHPFILHAPSQNHAGVARIINNPTVNLNAPMNLNRAYSDDYTLVEQVILRGLGVDHFDFQRVPLE